VFPQPGRDTGTSQLTASCPALAVAVLVRVREIAEQSNVTNLVNPECAPLRQLARGPSTLTLTRMGAAMRVILNSDVLYGDFSSNGLPAALVRLAEACAEQGHILVAPITTVLEIERRQHEITAGQRNQVEDARHTLLDQGISVPDFDVTAIIPNLDVRALLNDLAAEVQLTPPLLHDFEDAHRRACLHEAPHPPDTKSDEMRDLVIWAVSLRLSLKDGHALLVSKDTVHTHGRGDSEAAEANLARVDSLDAALDYLEVKTPAGEHLDAMISPSWPRVLEAGLPVGEAPMLLNVKDVQFVQGSTGPSSASGSIKVRGHDGQMITADVVIDVSTESDARLSLSNITAAGKAVADIVVKADYEPGYIEDDTERLGALRALLEEE